MTTYARKGGTYTRNGKTFVRRGVNGARGGVANTFRRHPVIAGLGTAGLLYGVGVNAWPIIAANPMLFGGLALTGLAVGLFVVTRRNARKRQALAAKGRKRTGQSAKGGKSAQGKAQPVEEAKPRTWDTVNAAGHVVATAGSRMPGPVPVKVGVTALGLGASSVARRKAAQSAQRKAPPPPVDRTKVNRQTRPWDRVPATPNQLTVLRRIHPDLPSDLTKGQAHDMLQRLRARG